MTGTHPECWDAMFGDDDYHDEADWTWLDRNYGGAPDECSACFIDGIIRKWDNCEDHNERA